MKRRQMLLASGALTTLAATRAWAQSSNAPKVIGWLFPFSQESQKDVLKDFTAQLAKLGHREGRDFVLEGRWTDGSVEKLSAFARELVALKPAAIVTAGTAAIAALQKETTSVPILFTAVGDPVASGFVASLARPGGNITGVMLRAELHGKLFDLIRETLPAVRRVATLEHQGDPVSKRMSDAIGKAAAARRYELQILRVTRIEELGNALTEAAKGKAEAMTVPQASLFVLHGPRIGELALKAQLPLFTTFRSFTAGGGLLSYYSDFHEAYRRGAAMLDKVLRGARPGDLPIEQPDRYNLVINMRTAKALGIKIPQVVLLRADEVIE